MLTNIYVKMKITLRKSFKKNSSVFSLFIVVLLQEEYGGLSEQQFGNLFRSLFERPGKLKKMWYQKSFLSILEKGIKPLRLVHVFRDQNEPAISRILKASENCKAEMYSYVNDPVLEKIMFVLSITKSSKDSLPILHSTFLQLLWGHLTFQGTNEHSKALHSKILSSLSALDDLSQALCAMNI